MTKQQLDSIERIKALEEERSLLLKRLNSIESEYLKEVNRLFDSIEDKTQLKQIIK